MLCEGAKCPVDICFAPTGVERRRTATVRKMSLKRSAAGGESCFTGFFYKKELFCAESCHCDVVIWLVKMGQEEQIK